MPPIDSQKHPELYVVDPNGTKMMIGEIKNFQIISDCDDFAWDSQILTAPTQEYTFTVKWYPSVRSMYFILHGRFPANNWLRMHGQRPCRKKR